MPPGRTPSASFRLTTAAPSGSSLPLQARQFTKEDFENPELFNVVFTQMINAVNQILGSGGPSILASGVDVRGSQVTGLGAPSGPTNAISQGHADATYSAAAAQPQLDIGGKYALKGLTAVYGTTTQQGTQIAAIQATLAHGVGVSGTITLAKLTGPGANGSITVLNGIITGFVNPT